LYSRPSNSKFITFSRNLTTLTYKTSYVNLKKKSSIILYTNTMDESTNPGTSGSTDKVSIIINEFGGRLSEFANELRAKQLPEEELRIACEQFMSNTEITAMRMVYRRKVLTIALSTANLQESLNTQILTSNISNITEYRIQFTKYLSDVFNNGESLLKNNVGIFDNPTEHLVTIYALSKKENTISPLVMGARHQLFKTEGIGTFVNFVEAFITRYIPTKKTDEELSYNDIRLRLKADFERELLPGGVIFAAMHININALKKNEPAIYGTGPFILAEDALEFISSLEEGLCPAYQPMADGSRRRIVTVLTEMFIDCIPDQVIQNLLLSRET
jgi:hypothetical protein